MFRAAAEVRSWWEFFDPQELILTRSYLSCLVCAAALALAGCSLFESGGSDSPDSGLGSPCASHADCAAAYVCSADRCVLEGSVGLGGACWATRDCEPDLYCDSEGRCAPAGGGGEGDPCITGAECERGLSCELYGFGGTCEASGTGDLGASCATIGDCIAGLVCNADNTCGPPVPFTGVECADDGGAFRVYFEVPRPDAPPANFFRLPFPSDVRVRADGTLDLTDFPRPGPGRFGVDVVDLYADTLAAEFSGFSSVGAVTFRVSADLDFDSLTDDSVKFIDITAGAPEYGSGRSRGWGYDGGRGLYLCQRSVVVRNSAAEPLLPGHTYAVFLTTAIRDASGQAPVQDADLAAVLGATRPTGEAMGRAWDAHAAFRAYLTDQAIGADAIAGAAVFTVQDTVGRTAQLAAATLAEPAPVLSDLTLCASGVSSPCDDGDVRVCGAENPDYYEIHGRFSVPIFQAGTAPYTAPADGGGIEFSSGTPAVVRTEDVCFSLTIPKNASMPVDGWPMVVFAHGTGGSFRSAINNGVAGKLATASTPMAVFSYDGVVHGARKAQSPRGADELMFNVINPRAARGNHWQGAVDVIQALRVAGLTIDVTGVGQIELDDGKVYFFGHSQGSNIGIPAIAVSSAAPAAVFSGAGSLLTKALLEKTSPVNAREGLELLIGEELSTAHPVMTLWQTFFDPVDTINFSPLLVTRPPASMVPKHVYMSYGTGDTYSPEETMELTARAAGLPVAEPIVVDLESGSVARPVSANVTTAGGDVTAACFQYVPDDYDGHFVSTRHPQATADWLEFLTSAATSGTPTVP